MSNVYEQVTDRIIAQLESGVIPWRKEWKSNGHSHLPTNYTTKKPYRGINALLLMATGFDTCDFLTYKQAQAIGAQVRKGEKGIQIVFWSTFEGKENDTEDAKRIPFLRTYTVFHVSQCDGIPIELPFDAPVFEPIPAAQAIADKYLEREHIELKHGGDRAFYSHLDYIQMPARESFASPDAYYSTLFHEMAHSTGAPHRLAREKLCAVLLTARPSASGKEHHMHIHPVFFNLCDNLRDRMSLDQPKPPAAEHPLFGPVIYAYTRAQAISDGVLVNLGMFVSQGRPVLDLVGIRFPVAMTSTAYAEVMGEGEGPELLSTDEITRRVLYFLAVLKRAILANRGEDLSLIEFTCTNAELKPIALKAVCGPGDNAEPVITVMLPGED